MRWGVEPSRDASQVGCLGPYVLRGTPLKLFVLGLAQVLLRIHVPVLLAWLGDLRVDFGPSEVALPAQFPS